MALTKARQAWLEGFAPSNLSYSHLLVFSLNHSRPKSAFILPRTAAVASESSNKKIRMGGLIGAALVPQMMFANTSHPTSWWTIGSYRDTKTSQLGATAIRVSRRLRPWSNPLLILLDPGKTLRVWPRVRHQENIYPSGLNLLPFVLDHVCSPFPWAREAGDCTAFDDTDPNRQIRVVVRFGFCGKDS